MAEQPETFKAEIRRRVGAIESHLEDLEQRLNDRGVFSGGGPDAGNPDD